jgi:flagellar assembly protein FliH
MTARAKFLFDADFSGRASAVEPTITVAAHQAAAAEAEQRGFRSGVASAEAQAEHRSAVALEHIATALERLAGSLKSVEDRLEAEAVDVAVAVAKKLAPELIAHEPFAEIAALATRCFGELIAAPHVVVRVNDALYAGVRSRLEDIARARGYEGRLVVLGEPEIAAGDCRIEWADGGLTRDRSATEAVIAQAVDGYVAVRRGEQTPTRVPTSSPMEA